MLVAAAGFVAAGPASFSTHATPNILVIMADDVGIESFEQYVGNPTNTADNQRIDTPSLTQLANEGVRFTNALSTPICTTTRVSMLTGQYNYRNYRAFGYLDNDQTTFAQVLQDNGYATHIAGKWQLSDPDPDPGESITPTGATACSVTPTIMSNDYGFDDYLLWQMNFTNGAKGSRFWDPKLEAPSADGLSSEVITTSINDYGPDLFTASVKDHITTSVASSTPFLSYYSMSLPHDPWDPTPDQSPTNSQKFNDSTNNFDDNVEYMDKLIGEMLAHLDDPNGDGNTADSVRDNTLVVFNSDNGTSPDITIQTDAGNVTGDKGTATYRGTAVPFIASWTGSSMTQGSVSHRMVDNTDLFATLLSVAGISQPNDLTLDGKAIFDVNGNVLNNKDAAYVWYDPKGRPFDPAVFAQDQGYKLYEDGRFYNIAIDPDETTDLSGSSLSTEAEASRTSLQGVIDFNNAIIQNPGGDPNTQTLIGADLAYRLEDNNNDGNGDAVNSTSSPLTAGDSNDGTKEFRAGFEFNLSAEDKLAITAGTVESIHFVVTVSETLNDPFNIVLVGYNSTDDADGVASASDYEAAATVLSDSLGTDVLGQGDLLSIDVTDFVLANADDDWLGFRIEVAGVTDAADQTPTVGDPDQFRFGLANDNDAALLIQNVPEPSSLVLLALGGVAVLHRRRR